MEITKFYRNILIYEACEPYLSLHASSKTEIDI